MIFTGIIGGDMKTYNSLVRTLKQKCPPAYPVSVRRVKLVDMDGCCVKFKEMFYIYIDKTISESCAIDTLIHEWAHAIAWNHLHDILISDEDFDDVFHSAAWGVAYSEVYRIYSKEFLDCSGPCKKRPKSLS